ncbi:carboxymuconolactone decarboxylase family protein [Legionella drozanskii]|uniref:Carboxymuconolactone decarboxylase family protein n=1 Tax=Legionella drozanskii LLAP-1 TaxID=1212489 RepID=A0A0W0SWV5_9GAMM|nr:carboxymuconolactone decarboxylase family protein [Legionella drozanskii]KTC87834.1 Carboxymuconolactone decarboxylase family protein [Legionella drozanskii LLAP-1]
MTTQYETGMTLLNKLHGKHTGKALMDNVGEISPKLTTMGIEWVFGDIMQDNALDLKTRELTIIASLVSQNGLSAQIKAHIEAALNVGATKREIIALIEQLAIYAGFPSANNAMLVAKEVFK